MAQEPSAFLEPPGKADYGQPQNSRNKRPARGGEPGAGNIDIWKLKLDGTGKDFVRLTDFNDYTGGKASNPVVSTDGKYMAFQVAKTTDPAGVGYGILLYQFKK